MHCSIWQVLICRHCSWIKLIYIQDHPLVWPKSIMNMSFFSLCVALSDAFFHPSKHGVDDCIHSKQQGGDWCGALNHPPTDPLSLSFYHRQHELSAFVLISKIDVWCNFFYAYFIITNDDNLVPVGPQEKCGWTTYAIWLLILCHRSLWCLCE